MFSAGCAAQSLPDFAGTWVQKYQGRVFSVLSLKMEGARLTGTIIHPKSFTFDQDGEFSRIASRHATYPLRRIALSGKRLEFDIDGDRYEMTLAGRDHALFLPRDDDYPYPPWKLDRSSDPRVEVSSAWPTPSYSPEIVALQKRLAAMVEADQKVRLAAKVSQAEMERIDRSHLDEILRVHEKYGWPRASIVGREASHHYWLLVQHQAPEVQRKILPDLEKAANSGEASRSDFAYLYDRVQVGLGKPQHWGSQVSCKEGKPVLDPVDDPAGLDHRRKELMMIPVKRYLKVDYLVRMCAQPPQLP